MMNVIDRSHLKVNKVYVCIFSPIDNQDRWYWRFEDALKVSYEKTWHGYFISKEAAEADAKDY